MTEPFDAAAFVARLQRATAEHARVTARRPTAPQLSEALGQGTDLLGRAVDILRNLAVLHQEQDPNATGIWPPSRGSLASGDLDTYETAIAGFLEAHDARATHWLDTNPYRNPVLWATDHLRRSYYTILDCLAGIAGLLARDDAHHLRAPIVLARSAFECAAWGAYITDPQIDSQERLRRILNLHFDEVQESLNAGGPEEGDDAGRADLIAFAEYCGFTVTLGRRPWTAPVIFAPGRTWPDSARQVIENVLPGSGVSLWRSLSAVAHGRSAPIPIPDEYSPPRRSQDVATSRVN